MNTAFPASQNRFNNGKAGYDNEFRIAHAQKSLSICLKHLWCRGELNGYKPPVCPVDGILLKSVHNYSAWTKVNTTEEYKSHLNLFKREANKRCIASLAEWELLTWKSPSENKDNKTKPNTTINEIIQNHIEPQRVVNSPAEGENHSSQHINLTYRNIGSRQLIYPKELKDPIKNCWQNGGHVVLEIDGNEILVKRKKEDYQCFRQTEINEWAKRKEELGEIHDRMEISATIKLYPPINNQ